MKFSTLFPVTLPLTGACLAVASPVADTNAATHPTFFLIRHAEKDKHGIIDQRGKEREKCLVKLFSKDSDYDIQEIITPKYHRNDPVTERPYNTTLPLAKSLGLTIQDACEYDDMACAAKEALSYKGSGNVLIAWEHVRLPTVAADIGAQDVPKYPDDRFDLIYTLPYPYAKVTVTSEDCPGLDTSADSE